MAKPPRVIGVLTEPAPPTWWRANRHKVLFIAGVLLGLYLCHHSNAAAQDPHPTRTPSPSRSQHSGSSEPFVKILPAPTHTEGAPR